MDLPLSDYLQLPAVVQRGLVLSAEVHGDLPLSAVVQRGLVLSAEVHGDLLWRGSGYFWGKSELG